MEQLILIPVVLLSCDATYNYVLVSLAVILLKSFKTTSTFKEKHPFSW